MDWTGPPTAALDPEAGSEPIRGASAVAIFGRCSAARARRVLLPELGAGAKALAVPGDGAFCALLDIAAVDEPRELRVEVDTGAGVLEAGRLSCEPPRPPGTPTVEAPVVVAMATYDPRADLFAAQVNSLREQTLGEWRCVVADDASSPAAVDAIRDVLADDERFVLLEHAQRVGPTRNFERALGHVGPATRFVALCDQDDRWYAGKLAALVGALESSDGDLAYCDCRVVDAEGRVLHGSFYSPTPNNHTDLRALLVSNSAPGAAMLVRRRLLDAALPFPAFDAHHDHWLAVLALARGGLTFVPEPLWDYVQHDTNVAGHATRRPPEGNGLGGRYAGVYRNDLLRIVLLAATLDLRLGRETPAATRAAVRSIRGLETDRRAQAALVWRALRSRSRPRASPTSGTEADLLAALVWRRLATLRR